MCSLNSSNQIDNADAGASAALNLSMHAANQNTFAVGGFIVENKIGKIIKAMHNNVMKPLYDKTNLTWDPTAHGERQFIGITEIVYGFVYPSLSNLQLSLPWIHAPCVEELC